MSNVTLNSGETLTLPEYAEQLRDEYRADIDAANAYYRETGDLAGFQSLNRGARECWEGMIHAVYAPRYQTLAARIELALIDAAATGGRVYAETDTGETVRIHTRSSLYAVTDTTGAPAEPLIGRINPETLRTLHTTTADLIRPAR